MIRNLNAVTFQSFGTVFSERPQTAKSTEKEPGMLLEVREGTSMVYRASSDTRLNCSQGKAVLSVSLAAGSPLPAAAQNAAEFVSACVENTENVTPFGVEFEKQLHTLWE